MRKPKIIELKTQKELDAWTTYSYITEPSLEIKHIKNLEDTVFFQGSGASKRRVAPYSIPPLKNTDPEILALIDEYHASVATLEKAFKEWDSKRIDMLSKLRELSNVYPRPYEDIIAILSKE
jgi:hypothetical protein